MAELSSNHVSIAEYHGALSDLKAAKILACDRHRVAQELGDIETGAQNLRELQLVFNRCKEIRQRLSPRDRLVSDYSIEPRGEHIVAVTLPAHTSAIQFLRMGDEFVRNHYGYEAVWLESGYASWAQDSSLLVTSNEDRRIIADACVDGTSNLIRDDQDAILKAKGLLPISIADLAVAHMAYQIALGADLFVGKVIRTADGGMIFNNLGLHTYHVDDWRRGDHTAMAARVG
jgi:hypothetical protein